MSCELYEAWYNRALDEKLFDEWCTVLWVTLPRIQGEGHGGPKGKKMADFKAYLLHRYAYNQKTNDELRYSPRQHLNVKWSFLYSSSFGVTWRWPWPVKLRVSHLRQSNFACCIHHLTGLKIPYIALHTCRPIVTMGLYVERGRPWGKLSRREVT